MKFLVVGLGNIGRRHLANLRGLFQDAELAVLRREPATSSLTDELKARVFSQIEEAIAFKPDAALICGPSAYHIEVAMILATNDIHLFVEKPISTMTQGVPELLSLCEEKNLRLMVGYNFRFYEPFVEMKRLVDSGELGRVVSFQAEVGQYLPDWRPMQDYREGVTGNCELGGGVLLELSHELDYLRWFFGNIRGVYGRVRKLSDLEIDVEDHVDLSLEFENGVVGTAHLDMIQRPLSRWCKIVGTQGTLSWNWDTHRVGLFRNSQSTWQEIVGPNSIERNDMYMAELKHFVHCIHTSLDPAVSGEDGLRALEAVSAAQRSSDSGCEITL
jgi:predicted dehydrogenase